MFSHGWDRRKFSMSLLVAVLMVLAMMVTAFCPSVLAAEAKQKTFASPEEAVKSLVDALKANDQKELLNIFGPEGKPLISSGDQVADRKGRDHFVQEYEEKNQLVKEGDNRVVLEVGKDDWPLPIPIVKEGETWRFDTLAGKEEILDRRIGRNELSAIQVCLAYVDAQREYATKDRNGDGFLEYAQRFASTKAKHNGLYWKTQEGEEQSPWGPLAAKAVKEGYGGKKPRGKPTPYHGYLYKILKAQGKNAPGGECDYVVNGKMIGGFAMVAYPAQYGSSGIMTFIVNYEDVVYEKDLGKGTAEIAQAMTKFDPYETWKKVE